ncbi:MAG: ribosome maturation factor RimM [Gemmatimonadales bacterium]
MEAAYLAVARFRKPHGLKGEVVMWALTDDPEGVLTAGRKLVPIDEAGSPIGEPLEIERARPYHRNWLVKFRKVDNRDVVETWGQRLVGMAATELQLPADDEMYVHEIPGADVVAGGNLIGKANALLDIPGGRLLAVNVAGKEVLVPFKKPILVRISRADRTIEIDPPAGLLDL